MTTKPSAKPRVREVRVLHAVSGGGLADHIGEFDFRETASEAQSIARIYETVVPVLCIEMPSIRAARARKKFEEATEEEQVVLVAKRLAAQFCRCSPDKIGGCEITAYSDAARAVLRVLKGQA